MPAPTQRILTERALDLGHFQRIRAAGSALPFWLRARVHVYVKLDFKTQFENARTAEDARKFLRAVTRAAMAAHQIGSHYEAVLLEVQGSMLHVDLPWDFTDRAKEFIAALHAAFRVLFDDSALAVNGWRMAVDCGETMLVAGRGVHGDDSFVSLGAAANRPAKYIYEQLEMLNERDRDLKVFHVGTRDTVNGRWQVQDLNALPVRLKSINSIANEIRMADPRLDFANVWTGLQAINAQAAPIAPAHTPMSPSPERPAMYFGWVLRSDLDGFCKCVDDCCGNDGQLKELADRFYCLMNAAADFTHRHRQVLAQLPWAGDNFTAAAVFTSKQEYDRELPTRIIELSADFDKEMNEAATECGFGGWAQAAAGGEVHGNAGGNVYLAGALIDGRRFLVGVGEGFGRSAQAFNDIDPAPRDLVVYEEDWEHLDSKYKDRFKPAPKRNGGVSTVYRIARIESLHQDSTRRATVGSATAVTFVGGATRHVPSRPFAE